MEILFHIYEIAHPLIYVKNDIMTSVQSEFFFLGQICRLGGRFLFFRVLKGIDA